MAAFAFGALSLQALDRNRSLDQFTYQTWQTENGLPQNTVHSILQSRDGYIWFGTEDGLVRFDGFRFTVFDSRNTPTLGSNNIRSLAEDNAGTLWIAAGDGVLSRAGDRFVAHRAADSAEEETVLSLGTDRQGNVWALMPHGIECMRVAGSHFYGLGDEQERLTGAWAVARDGRVLLGSQRGLLLFENGHFQTSSAFGSLPSPGAQSLLVDSLDNLWVGTAKGLYKGTSGDWRHFTLQAGLPESTVVALFEDREQTLWVGTENGPARLPLEGGRDLAHEGRILPGTMVLAFAEDAEGDIWVGTDAAGISILREAKFTTYSRRDGLAGDIVRCVYASPDGVVWIGTDHGLTRRAGGGFSQLTTRDGLSSDVILSLASDAAGDLLIGTPDGLNRLHAGKISVVTSADGLPDDFIRSTYCDRDGSLWIGTRHGLAHLAQGQVSVYTQNNGLGSDLVGSVMRGRDGTLWIATLGGLTQYRDGRFRNYRRQDGLSSNVVTALHEDSAGNLWIGTRGGGLNVLRHGKLSHSFAKLGLPDSVFGILEDETQSLWLSSNSGIVRVTASDLLAIADGKSEQATVVWYGTSDGMRISECGAGGHPGVFESHDGTLWFSTLKGVAALFPSARKLNRVPPPVVLETVSIDDHTIPAGEVNKIAPDHSRLAFEYAGLSFAAPQKVQYRYRLAPFDKSWVDGGTRRTAFYTNIPPGNYRFEVLARNNDGFWSRRPAALAFYLAPHFYQTLWFYALLLLAAAAAAYSIYRWRVAEVEARFGAVLQERTRIAREIHDTLAQGFVGVSVQLEIVSRLLATSVEAANKHLDQARLLVRDSIGEARQSIWQLRSQVEQPDDLASRLSKAANQIVAASPVKLSLQVRGAYRPLSRQVEDELLRIGQEAVNNAVRHSSAERVEIELAFETKRLRLTVSDDGRGFSIRPDGTGPEGHYGLKGMRERAEQIGAHLVVDSAEGKGTRIFVETPVA